MAIGTEIQFNDSVNFSSVPLYEPFQLNFKVELGYLKIKPRNTMAQTLSWQLVNNEYFPPPGGTKGESFVNSSRLKEFKSSGLSQTTNGIAPSLMEPGGAPFATFITASIVYDEPHPYYNLILAPKSEKYSTQSVADFSLKTPLIQKNDYKAIDTNQSKQFNKLGGAFVPSSSKSSTAVQALLDKGDIEPLITYNIWEVDNINQQYFSLQKFLGWVPKTGTQSKNLQPYAQTWPFTDAAAIQVYASNSQVSLTRKYPISKDYLHDKKAKYCIYKSYEGSENTLVAQSVNLHSDNFIKPNGSVQKGAGKQNAVGFTLVFNSITASNTIPQGDVGISEGSTVITEPRIIISWGSLDNPKKYDNLKDQKVISLYTLEIDANRPARIYFNVSAEEIKNNNIDPNHNFIELKDLNLLKSFQKNSGSKSPNQFTLTVYYSGPYMYIGEGLDRSKWHTVAKPNLKVVNNSKFKEIEFSHYLDDLSKINITAQFVNFTFMYGPPVFNPHDDQNLPGLASNYEKTANSYNYARSQTQITNDEGRTDEEIKELYESQFDDFFGNSSAVTFQDYNNPTLLEGLDLVGGAASYLDIRAVDPKFKTTVTIPLDEGYASKVMNYITSFPTDLGGHVYSKQFAQSYPDPDITKSYVVYLPEITELLSQSLTKISITKSVDKQTLSTLTSHLDCEFFNLNKTEEGIEVTQFIRQNVCVIKISAGYGDDLHTYFEGMVDNNASKEKLEESKFNLIANDLLSALFISPETSIVSRNQMIFVGMKYRAIINALVDSTELKDHFRYELSGSLYEFMTKKSIPRIPDTFVGPLLASLRVSAYSDSENYYNVLKQICGLSVQTKSNNSKSESGNKHFDIPILYWYVNEVNGDTIDGIVMSSRKELKDKDKLYLRKSAITEESISDIEFLHGCFTGVTQFESNSTTNNLATLGIMRFQQYDGTWQSVFKENPLAFPNIFSGLNTKGYVGYDRIVLFDNPSRQDGVSVYTESTLLATKKEAQNYLDRWMTAVYENVYENLNISVFVTKPLKEHGYFTICVESDEYEINEDYLYNQVAYNFDIDKNLIVANVSGAKKLYMNL